MTYTSKGAKLLQRYANEHPENVVWDANKGWTDQTTQTFEPGTVVDIQPDKNGCNYTNNEGWTVVGPTRHPYAVVVREPQFGTTCHMNIDRLTVKES